MNISKANNGVIFFKFHAHTLPQPHRKIKDLDLKKRLTKNTRYGKLKKSGKKDKFSISRFLTIKQKKSATKSWLPPESVRHRDRRYTVSGQLALFQAVICRYLPIIRRAS